MRHVTGTVVAPVVAGRVAVSPGLPDTSGGVRLRVVRDPAVTRRRLRSGRWHKCPNCGTVDTREVGHCADGQYGGCGRSFSSDAVFDAHHYFDEQAGRWVCLDPGSLLDKHGRPRFVARPSSIDGHDVWGEPGGRPRRTSGRVASGPENGPGVHLGTPRRSDGEDDGGAR